MLAFHLEALPSKFKTFIATFKITDDSTSTVKFSLFLTSLGFRLPRTLSFHAPNAFANV